MKNIHIKIQLIANRISHESVVAGKNISKSKKITYLKKQVNYFVYNSKKFLFLYKCKINKTQSNQENI